MSLQEFQDNIIVKENTLNKIITIITIIKIIKIIAIIKTITANRCGL